MNRCFHRRELLAAGAMGALATFSGNFGGAESAVAKTGIGLGFSLYGMKTLSLEDGLKACAEIGYDCVEIPVMPDWPADSRKFSPDQQRGLREALVRNKLRLSALMENLPLVAEASKHQDNLARLKLAGELAHSLSPDRPALIETVLGGAPMKWDELKLKMLERLGEWEKVAAAAKTVLAIKAHVGNALHTPEDTKWLIEQINSPWLKVAYDYSHFALRKIDMEESVKTLIPHSVFMHVKDEQGDPGKFQFLLPGEGQTDYEKLLRLVAANGYGGDVVVEVSGQIFSRPGYDPLAAAKNCFQFLAPAFERAGVRRRKGD